MSIRLSDILILKRDLLTNAYLSEEAQDPPPEAPPMSHAKGHAKSHAVEGNAKGHDDEGSGWMGMAGSLNTVCCQKRPVKEPYDTQKKPQKRSS